MVIVGNGFNEDDALFHVLLTFDTWISIQRLAWRFGVSLKLAVQCNASVFLTQGTLQKRGVDAVFLRKANTTQLTTFLSLYTRPWPRSCS